YTNSPSSTLLTLTRTDTHQNLHSFPTRRSSDLTRDRKYDHQLKGLVYCMECGNKATLRCREEKRKNGTVWRVTYFICSKRNNYRSEEHTSELQSRFDLVCRLLLEKKKKKKNRK